ncbi:hypothetical protein GCM10022240_05710 [Microbacterium kribbense]|uniref:Uncharacterized protein n=1 Tax=Microbacterium kribbense TaxID=433645 RepID=A0ABP7G5L5_9MICO
MIRLAADTLALGGEAGLDIATMLFAELVIATMYGVDFASPVASISEVSRAPNSCALSSANRRRSACAAASGSQACSTHHWSPSRPWLRMAVYEPCTVRECAMIASPSSTPGT